MQQPINLYISLVYFITAIPYAWLGLVAWRRRPAVAVTPFAWAMLGMSIWSLGYGVELLTPSLLLKLLSIKFEYIGIVIIPVFLFIFSLEFTGRRHVLPQKLQSLLWLYPIFFLALVWTNEIHNLMWSGEAIIQTAGVYLIHLDYKLFFWAQIVFSYLLILASNILLIRELIKSPSIYGLQASLVVIGLISPIVGNVIFITDSATISGLDSTPLFFIPTAFALYWVTMRYRLLKVLPLEHLTILQNMKEGVIVVDALKRVLYINPITENLFGRSEGDAIGQPLYQLSSKYGNEIASYLTAGMSQAELRLGEGEQARVFEATISSASSLNASAKSIGPDSMITLHDVTQRKEAERILHRRELLMSAISIAATEFLNEPAWEHAVPGVLEKIGTAVDISHVYVFINYIGENDTLFTSLCHEWASPEAKPQLNNPFLRHLPIHQNGLSRWEKEFLQGQHILGLVKDLPAPEQALFKTMESISILAFPIVVDQQWWGFIMFDECGFTRYWSDIEVKALHTMATIFSSAETRARTQQKLIRRQNALSLLQDIVREALQAKDLNKMAQDIVDSIGLLIHADGCFIALWDEATNTVRPLAAYGVHKEEYLSFNVVPGKLTFTESALNLGHTLIIEDVHTSNYADQELIEKIPYKSIIVIPLVSIEKKLGTILLSFNHHHHFQPEEIAISEQAASLISLAFEKFLAVEQAHRRAETSETLRKVGVAVAQTLETKETISKILEELKQVISYDSASVQLLDGNELEIVGGSGFKDPSKVVGMRFPLPGDNPNSIVFETGKPLILEDAVLQYHAFDDEPNNHIHSWLGVPLIANNKIIGLLTIDSSEINNFTNEDLNLATLFADQVASALDNSRLFKQTQDQAMVDPLTGIYNRRGLFQIGESEFERSLRLNRNFSAMMIDIDHFKNVNDTYGHDIGDKVLKEFASYCKKCVREIDVVGRYGGEEIVILLPDTDLDLSLIVAERVRKTISSSPINIREHLELNVTASLGIAYKDENTASLDILIKRADQAMYIAKHKGRNQVAYSK